MKEILIYPTYFPSIAQMVAVAQAEKVVFELHDNYQKQTYRNRANIAHSNGVLLLNVPIKHTKDGKRQKTSEVVTESDFSWNEHHLKSLQSAYRTSPYFEFYEDEILHLFSSASVKLQQHNLAIFETLSDFIGLECEILYSETYEKDPTTKDLRYLANAKGTPDYPLEKYTQVLQANHGYLNNLCILDLLFNEGPNSLNYLERQKLNFS